GHVHELYNKNPKDDNAWQNSSPDLSDTTGATGGYTAIGLSPLIGYYDFAFGIQHVFYIGHDQGVRELWHQGGSWNKSELTAKAGGAQPAMKESALAGFFDGSYQHVFYQSTFGNGDITWLYSSNGSIFSSIDLTVKLGAPLGNLPTSMTGYYDTVSVGRMFYVT